MTITAKFSTVCPSCNGRIEAGAKVEWAKGQKARHVSCATAGGKTAPSAPARKSYARRGGKWTGCSCGSREDEPRDSDCWTCRHDSE